MVKHSVVKLSPKYEYETVIIIISHKNEETSQQSSVATIKQQ